MLLVEIMKRVVLKPLALRTTEDGLMEKTGGRFAVKLKEVENVTVPANPLKLVMVIVELPVWPFPREISVRLLAILKVGTGDTVYVAP